MKIPKYVGFRPSEEDMKMIQELKEKYYVPDQISNAFILRLALKKLYEGEGEK
ncbi:MAG TPA: hypothetical protein VFF20_10360 [Pseudogracilibacillus sp.]|nr:hypothetical protein [Pseudogracilibacillus sp.]